MPRSLPSSMRPALFLAITGLLTSFAVAQDNLDQILTEATLSGGTPGIAVAVIRGGKVEYTKCAGYADLENQIPLTAQSAFQLGSMTKQFTATAVMMLVEQGKVSLEDPITKLIETPQTWREIKIRHLLNQTSGLNDYSNQPGFGDLSKTPASHDKVIGLIRDLKLVSKPGDQFQYCNSNYYLLGMVVEKIRQQPLRAAFKHLIFDPLEMRSTDMNLQSEIVPKRVRGYISASDKFENVDAFRPEWAYGAGALVSTMDDLIKWDAAQGSPKLLKPESWKLMYDPAVLNNGDLSPYAFGWRLAMNKGVSVVEHGGRIAGFTSQFTRYPSKNVSIIVLTNNFMADAKALAIRIARQVDPSLEPPRHPTEPIADPSPDLSKKLEAVFEKLLSGKGEEADFEESFRKEIFPDEVKKFASQLASMGELSAFTLVSASDEKDAKHRGYTFMLGKQKLIAYFTVNAKGEIAGMSISPIR